MRKGLRYIATVSQIAALILVLVLAVLSRWSISSLIDNQARVDHTHVVIDDLSSIEKSIADARKGTRAFVITGSEAVLQPYPGMSAAIRQRIELVRRATGDNPRQQRNVNELMREVITLLARFDHVIEVRRHDATAAVQLVKEDEAAHKEAPIRRTIDSMRAEELRLLDERTRRTSSTARRTAMAVVIGNVVAVLAVLGTLILNRREMGHRRAAEKTAKNAARELSLRIVESEQRAAQVHVLATFGEYLQVAQSEAEAGLVAARWLAELLPQSGGEVFAIAPSRDALERSARWPEGSDYAPSMTPNDCWALRKGSVHLDSGGMRCAHVRAPGISLCVPMSASGEVIGLLSVQWPAIIPSDHLLELARSAAEQLSLTYSGIALRDALRRQAIRDPLTGLFNRRYAEESLTREIGRAARRGIQLSVMLIDADFFKQFNDTLGHSGGDRLLREISAIIAGNTRTEDVAARYGGDEFLVIMTESKIEHAIERAELIAQKVRALPIIHPETNRGPSLSIGIAAFPDHGSDAAMVIEAADVALYRAKRNGRDRVESAQPVTHPQLGEQVASS